MERRKAVVTHLHWAAQTEVPGDGLRPLQPRHVQVFESGLVLPVPKRVDSQVFQFTRPQQLQMRLQVVIAVRAAIVGEVAVPVGEVSFPHPISVLLHLAAMCKIAVSTQP